jgi:hypothetical protein
MIVWGGHSGTSGYANTGGIYDPVTNTWTPLSTTDAPAARADHTAVWTGSKMIVWGGHRGFSLNTGGVYDPAMGTWVATGTTNAPLERDHHAAVWTGSTMIVWGGYAYDVGALDTGSVYDPAIDAWTATSPTNAPTARVGHTAVWTGSRMIVWGGSTARTGGVYDPATDAWTATSTLSAPSGPLGHTAVRMGSKTIVWGGSDGELAVDTGGTYDAATDAWTATTTTGTPPARRLHTAVWTGSRMIVWGGFDVNDLVTNTGGVYAPPGTEGPLVAGVDRVVPMVPQCGIPDGAQALSVNLAVTEPTRSGSLRLYPAGTTVPTVSAINFSSGQTRSNNAVAMPNVSGELAVRLAPSGTAHFILDVNGYFDSSGAFFTLTPCRALDTRNP